MNFRFRLVLTGKPGLVVVDAEEVLLAEGAWRAGGRKRRERT